MPAQTYDFQYPDYRSYTQLPHSSAGTGGYYDNRTLRHGYIFGYKDTSTLPSVTGYSEEIARQILDAAHRRVDFNNSKIFQFNPADLNVAVTMMAVDSTESQGVGNLPGIGVGAAKTSLELIYDRTQEIAMANNGKGNPKWRDLGVQVDLFELLTVISGGSASRLGGYKDEDQPESPYPGPIKPGSLNHLTGIMLDAAVTGSQLMMKPFAIVFNSNLAVHVLQMDSFVFGYLRFTKDLVPTSMKIELDLTITNMGTMSHVTSGGAAGATTGPASTGTSSAAPPGTSTGSIFDISRTLGW